MLDIETTVRYEWRDTSRNGRPSVSGLARPCLQREVCVPHVATDMRPAGPSRSAASACRSEALGARAGGCERVRLKLHTLVR
jgi:hypothetical protein